MSKMTNETIQVTVSERGDNRAVYDARIGDRLTSRQPLLAAARVLVGEGVDPSAVLEMKRPGSSHVALRAPVGVAARLTVDESRPRFVPWPRGARRGMTDIITKPTRLIHCLRARARETPAGAVQRGTLPVGAPDLQRLKHA